MASCTEVTWNLILNAAQLLMLGGVGYLIGLQHRRIRTANEAYAKVALIAAQMTEVLPLVAEASRRQLSVLDRAAPPAGE
jgi:hypothetical protein